MKCFRWGVALTLVAAMIALTGCEGFKLVRRGEYEHLRDMEELNAQQASLISQLTHDKERLTGENNSLKALLATKEDLIAEITRDVDNAQGKAEGIPSLAGVDIERGAEGIDVIVGSDVLFDTGQASLKTAAEETLKSIVVQILNSSDYQDRKIRVSGFTDSVWTGSSPSFKSNFELSAARALSVLDFLKDQGVDAGRMHFAGYGEHDLVPNADGTENKKASRRVKIVLLHDWVAAVKEQPLAPAVPK